MEEMLVWNLNSELQLCPGSYMAIAKSHSCSKLQFPQLIKRVIKPQKLEVLFKYKNIFIQIKSYLRILSFGWTTLASETIITF
jgi:hypothetical protein